MLARVNTSHLRVLTYDSAHSKQVRPHTRLLRRAEVCALIFLCICSFSRHFMYIPLLAASAPPTLLPLQLNRHCLIELCQEAAGVMSIALAAITQRDLCLILD